MKQLQQTSLKSVPLLQKKVKFLRLCIGIYSKTNSEVQRRDDTYLTNWHLTTCLNLGTMTKEYVVTRCFKDFFVMYEQIYAF